MEIIKCELDHLDELGEFCDTVTLYLEQNINYPKWTHKGYPSRASAKLAIEAGYQYICLEDGKIIGMFILNEDPQGAYSKGDWTADLKDGEFLVIHSLAADPSMYGKGIGKFMVDYCIDLAKLQNYKGIRLDVVPTNIVATRLYEKMGFNYVGTEDLERGIEEIPEFKLYELNL